LQQVNYGDWRIVGADVLVICRLVPTEQGWQAELQVHDPFRSKLLSTKTFQAADNELRRLSHHIANHIYQTVTGISGHFDTHILYVRKRGDMSDLVYMDQDSANRQTVGKNFTLLLSPDWSPDGRRVALNTYVGNRPKLEFFDLKTGTRTSFGEFPGLNSTPEFSPDGRYIAAALSHTGNTEIHVYDLKKRAWKQFTYHPAIDTTPTWSPDGKWLAFTSNRNGTPQIYRKHLSGGKAERISLEASYNTSPVWAPHGDRIAFITLKTWAYALATVHIDGSDIRYLATGERVESPAWSPNGQMLLFSAETRGIRRLFRIPSWGGKAEAITPANIDASDAAWSR
jgi:TolB protein